MEELVIPAYKIGSVAYRNPNTMIYQATHEKDKRSFFLKTQTSDYPSMQELANLKHEYSLLKTLSHSGIIQAFDLMKVHNRLVLVLEYFPAISLKEWLKGKSIPLKSFYAIALQLTDILTYLHSQKIIHKDIKPANILIDPETLHVTLIDLGLSSRLSFETQGLVNPNILEGTIAYLSPEQTGRMNRIVDYRSDFYSLGVTFYEMLAGKLPFEGEDALELVHAHLAKVPTPIHALQPHIPLILSELVAKLMAKSAEERYASATGIKNDLLQCQALSQEGNLNALFQLGQRDVKNHLVISQKLYGREAERKELLDRIDAICIKGTQELILVAGASGIGKTAFIQEIYRPLSERSGFFVRGKFDILQRHISYFALIQVFTDLVNYILMEPQEKLLLFKNEILEAAGPNGKILIDLIPSIELILGKQPDVIELPPDAAKNRLNMLFQRFINVFATEEHPLILFIDDLQWADSASLNLMETLFLQSRYFAIIGAYRDNEVMGHHPLLLTIEALQKQKIGVTTLPLRGLKVDEITQLLEDSLGNTEKEPFKFAALLFKKTAGNPFFINEFLKAIYREHLLSLSEEGKWTWNIDTIDALPMTTNVVDLIAANIEKLPADTKHILGIAACIGNAFDLHTLVIVMQSLPSQIAQQLWPAIQNQLIVTVGETYKQAELANEERTASSIQYKFLHDKVQEAALKKLSSEGKKQTHLNIGRLLLQDEIHVAENLYTIVDHLNQSLELLQEAKEVDKLSQLNAMAGEKAKSSTAYEAALNYFKMAISLSKEEWWIERYSWMLRLHKNFAECESQTKHYAEAEIHLKELLKRAKNDLDQADIYLTMAQCLSTATRHAEACEIAIKGLHQLGVRLFPHPGKFHILKKILTLKLTSTLPSVRKKWQDLSPMTDPYYLKIMQLLYVLLLSAYISDPLLSFEVGLNQMTLSVKHGYTHSTVQGLILWTVLLVSKMHNLKEARFWANLAIQYTKKVGHFDYYTNLILASCYVHWHEPLRNLSAYYKRSIKSANEEGALFIMLSSIPLIYWSQLFAGEPLKTIEEAAQETVLRYEKYQIVDSNHVQAVFVVHSIHYLQAEIKKENDRFSDLLKEILAFQDVKTTHHAACCLAALFYCVLSNFSECLNLLSKAKPTIDSITGFFFEPIEKFYYGLSLIACLPGKSGRTKQRDYKEFKDTLSSYKFYGEQCPVNYFVYCCFLLAEEAVYKGNRLQAEELYAKALEQAVSQENLPIAALISERTALFYFSLKKEEFGRLYLKKSHYYYKIWGAKLKTDLLEEKHPWLRGSQAEASSISKTSSNPTTGHSLDFLSILKANRILSSEIYLDQFLKKMLKILMENAGGQRGVFLEERRSVLTVEAEGEMGREEIVLSREPAAARSDLPLSLFAYVLRSRQPVIIQQDIPHRFSKDPYLMNSHPKSALCIPILYQNNVLGLLYLENNAVEGAFTQERVEVLDLLAAQAAISLENARIYEVTGRFVPVEFLQQLARKSLAEFDRGDHVQQTMSVLFCDIRDFTTLSEGMAPAEVFQMINEFLAAMEPCIERHHGFIDKYIGDAIMALFKGEADDALNAAIAMLNNLKRFNEETKHNLAIGIGINTGELILGIMGGKVHLAGSVIGDSVNLASRIESLTKGYGTPLLIGGKTKKALVNPAAYSLRLIDQVKVKGKSISVDIWEVCDVNPDPIRALKMETLEAFNRGREAYLTQDLELAKLCFEECLTKNPQDLVAELYLKRCL